MKDVDVVLWIKSFDIAPAVQGIEKDILALIDTRQRLLEAIEKPCEGDEKASDRLIELRSLAKAIRG
jgi:hypothetical protein